MSAVSPRGETANNSTTTPLLGDRCPKCKSTEAWHGCITEDDSTKYACDECGASITIKSAPKPKPAKPRRFELTAAIEDGFFFVQFNDRFVLTFQPGRLLEIGSIAITTTRQIADGEDREFYRGLDAGRKQAEEAAA